MPQLLILGSETVDGLGLDQAKAAGKVPRPDVVLHTVADHRDGGQGLDILQCMGRFRRGDEIISSDIPLCNINYIGNIRCLIMRLLHFHNCNLVRVRATLTQVVSLPLWVFLKSSTVTS